MTTLAVTGRFDLTGEQWAQLEPLLPAGKRPGRPSQWTKRQLIDGVRWRVRVGAPWRDVPERYGSWQAVYALFRRWQRSGVWARIVAGLQARADAAGSICWEVSVDSTICRAHQHAAGARRQPDEQAEPPGGVVREPADHALGRSRGGLTTKIYLSCEQGQRVLSLLVTAGQWGDSPQFQPVLEKINVPRLGPGRPRKRPERVRADKAYRMYLRGLLLDGRRKSMQPMAGRLGVDHQGLQQFVTSSTWDFSAVRQRLAVRAVEVVEPVAWAVDDTGFVKDGRSSPGVARQYSGTLGKVGNCQIGVSVHAVTDSSSCPLNWRLFLPPAWDHTEDDEQAAQEVALRRRRCGIPETERYRPKWRMAVEMLDELTGWGLRPPVVVADAGYGDNAHLRAALAERGLGYVVQVKGQVTAHPADACPQLIVHERSGPGRWSLPRYRTKPVSLREHVLAAGRTTAQTLAWRHGSKGILTSQFVILPVRVAGRRPRLGTDRTLPLAHVIAQWPHDEPEPVKYWLSNLPADTPPADLVRLAKIRWRIEHDYRELKTALGLDHFEGRSWTGWHRHVTLVTAAHLFCTELRADRPKALTRV